jgi:hypothetical protein
MHPQTHADAQPGFDSEHETVQESSRVSRRSLLRGAAGLGVVGVAAAAGVGVATAATRPTSEPTMAPAAKPVTVAAMPETAMAGPLVVYLRDTTTGEFDVFGGTGQVSIKNPALVSQLLKNVQLAW